MSLSSRFTQRPLKLILIVGAIVLLVLGLFAFRFIVLGALVGLGGGVLLAPPIRFFRDRSRIPHGLSVALVTFLLLALGAGLGFGIYKMVAGQAQRLTEQAPQILETLTERWYALTSQFPWLEDAAQDFEPGAIFEQAGQFLFRGVKTGVEAIGGALVILMIAIFVAANASSYFEGFLALFTPKVRPRVDELGRGSARVVRKWFVGQMIVLLISATLIAIALAIIGVDYWLLIALLTIFLDFIPFFGAILTGLIAALLTLGTEPEKVWWVLLAYIAVQQIESNITLPIVMKERIRLPEAHLLVFLLIMGSAFGVLGIFASPPLFAVLHYLCTHAYMPWIQSKGRPKPA